MSGADDRPGVVPRRRARRRRINSPLVIGTAVASLFGLVLIWRLWAAEAPEPAPLDSQGDPVRVQRVPPRLEPSPILLPTAASLTAPMPPARMPMPSQAVRTLSGPGESGPLTTTYEGEPPSTRSETAAAAPVPDVTTMPRTGHVDFKPFAMQGAESGVVADLSHTIKPTTRALCTLDQAIDAQHEGPLVCHLAQPVLAWDNSWPPLLPKGTPILGSYQSLSIGQGRLMAIAAHAIRSDGVIVPLGAPFTDDLGRIGVPGYVDTRFWERFGNAIIMDATFALIGLPQAALTSRQPGTTNLSFNIGSTEGVLSEVLRSTVNLPPVLRKNQGEDIAILITQPIHVGPIHYEVSQ